VRRQTQTTLGASTVLGASRTIQRGAPAVAVSATGSSSSQLAPIVLGIAIALVLLAAAFALMRPSALPRPIGIAIYERRSSLIFGYLAIVASVGFGIAIGLLS
jgi:hypothetical protein